MKSILSFFVLFALIAGMLPIPVLYAATPIVNTTLSLKKTWSEPFDTDPSTWWIGSCTDFSVGSWHSSVGTFPDGSSIDDGSNGNPGDNAWKDNCEDNDVVRLWDSVTYNVEVSVNDSDVDELISVVRLDDGVDVKQEWIELPSACVTDPALVSQISELQDMNSDGVYETMICNLWKAVEGTTKVFFPAAKVLWKTSSSGSAILNDEVAYATTSAYGTSTFSGDSAIVSTGPVFVNITADFRVDLKKVLSGKWYNSLWNPVYPTRVDAKGSDGTTDGYIVKYDLTISYEKWSMLADDSNGDGTSDYTFLDYFTDDNINNDGAFSSNIELYTWWPDGASGGCNFNDAGVHGATATMTCTQIDNASDYTGPSYTPDGINDRNILIEYENIDPTDPDNDSNIVDSFMTIWVPRTEISTHQTCSATCTNNTLNQWNAYDVATSSLEPFVIESTEYNVAGDKLLNYNGVWEPWWYDSADPSGSQTANNNNDTYLMDLTNPGIWAAYKTFYGANWTATSQPKTWSKGVSQGEVFNFLNYAAYNSRASDWRSGQICDKIDTQNLEFVWPSQAPWFRYPWNYSGSSTSNTQANPSLRIGTYDWGYEYFDANDYPEIFRVLYSNEAHGTLLEQRDDTCDDDVNGDGVVNIKYNDGTGISDASFPIDWYEDPSEVQDIWGSGAMGEIYVSKIRSQINLSSKEDVAAIALNGDEFQNYYLFFYYDVQVKDDAIGYGSRQYITNYSSRREFVQGTTPWSWANLSAYSIDPEAISFSLDPYYTDRVQIQSSGIGVGKKTIPEGIKVVVWGDIIEFVLTPEVFGRWSGSQEVEVNDNLPANTDYIEWTEMFSVDNGVTWVDFATYNANYASGIAGYDVSIIWPTSPHGDDADPLEWTFWSVEFDTVADRWDSLPQIKYKVLMDPTKTSGNYTNTVTLTSPNLAPVDLQKLTLESASSGISGTIDMPYSGYDYTQVEIVVYEQIAGYNGSTATTSVCRRYNDTTHIASTNAGADGSYNFSSSTYPTLVDGTEYCVRYYLPNTKKSAYTLTIVPEFGFDVLKNVTKEVYSVNENFFFDLSYKNLWGEAYTGWEFIDILPFNGDASTTIGWINSVRKPESDFKDDSYSYYEFKWATFSNNEDFWVTD